MTPTVSNTPQEPIRVALVITDLEVGGAEKCLTQLALRVDRRQFNPSVYVLQPRPKAERAAYVEQLESAGVNVTFLNGRSFVSLPRVIWQLWRLFRRDRVQVVQCFLYHANVVGTIAARLAGIRRVFVGVRVAEPSKFRRRVEKWVYWLAHRLVYVSKSVRRAYRHDRWGFPFVISNGIDVEPYQSAISADLSSSGIADEVRLILYVGRLDTQKGLDWFFQLLPRIVAQLPKHHFAIVGDGPERQALAEQAAAQGFAKRVHFLGWRPDVPRLMKRAEMLVLPSRYEGMPNVVLEAMAAERATVATRTEGIHELLGPRTSLLTVNFGDDEEMVKRVVDLARINVVRENIAAELYFRVRKLFSLTEKIRCYEALWREPISAAAAAYPESPSPPRDTPAPGADST